MDLPCSEPSTGAHALVRSTLLRAGLAALACLSSIVGCGAPISCPAFHEARYERACPPCTDPPAGSCECTAAWFCRPTPAYDEDQARPREGPAAPPRRGGPTGTEPGRAGQPRTMLGFPRALREAR